MSLQTDLLAQALHLLRLEPRRPRQASLRRAISAAYYALFHLLIDESVKFLLPARHQGLQDCLRRAFDHGAMKAVCSDFASTVPKKLRGALTGTTPSPALRQVAKSFLELQQDRHDADYNVARKFTRVEAQVLVRKCQTAFAN